MRRGEERSIRRRSNSISVNENTLLVEKRQSTVHGRSGDAVTDWRYQWMNHPVNIRSSPSELKTFQ